MEDKREKQLEWLKAKLKNVSQSNRSLCLKRMPMRRVFSLVNLNQYQDLAWNKILTNILDNSETTSTLLPIFSPEINEDEETIGIKLSKQLTILNREVEFLVRDKGDAYFNLGYPFVVFHTNNDLYFRAPLVLVPCSLSRDTSKKRPVWKLNLDGTPTINELIFEALAKNNGAIFPDNFLSGFEDSSILNLINKGIKVLSDAGFKVNNSITKGQYFEHTNNGLILTDTAYNALEFSKKEKFIPIELYNVEEIKQLKKEDIPAKKNLDLNVISTAFIGQFPRHSSMLESDYSDYKNNINTMADPIVDQLILGGTDLSDISPVTEEMLNEAPKIEERQRFFLVPANGTQEKIILAVRDMVDTGFVADGPPGTGKSQMIVNLIADNIANNKTTLLVCEKRAALDVVYNRMKNSNLIDHVLLIHSATRDRDEAFAAVSNTIEKAEDMTERRVKILQNKLEGISEKIQEEVSYLNRYTEALHKTREHGLSLFQSYSLCKSKSTIFKLSPSITSKYSYKDFSASIDKVKEFFGDAKSYYSLNLSAEYSFKENLKIEEDVVKSIMGKIDKLNSEYQEAKDLVKEFLVGDVISSCTQAEIKDYYEKISKVLSILVKQNRNEVIVKLINENISENEFSKKRSILSSIMTRLPEDFVAIDGLSDKEILDYIEEMRELLKLEGSMRRNLVTPFKHFFEKFEKVAREELFDSLTKYELITRNDPTAEGIYEFLTENRKLLADIFNGTEISDFKEHHGEVLKFISKINKVLIVDERFDRGLWDNAQKKLEEFEKMQKSIFRFINPAWYRSKKALQEHILKLSNSIEQTSFNKRDFIMSNIAYADLLEYTKPIERDLCIESKMSFKATNERVLVFTQVMECLDLLKELFDAYLKIESEAPGKFGKLYNKYKECQIQFYEGKEVEIKQIINDLNATRILIQYRSDIDSFRKWEGFPPKIDKRGLDEFLGYLNIQEEAFHYINAIDFKWLSFIKRNISEEGVATRIAALKELVETYFDFQAKSDKLKEISNIVKNLFSEESIEKINKCCLNIEQYHEMYFEICKFLSNYRLILNWKRICQNINDFELEMSRIISLTETDEPFKKLKQAYLTNWIQKIEDENSFVKRFSEEVYERRRGILKSNIDEKYRIVGDYLAANLKYNGRGCQSRDLIRKLTFKRRKKTIREIFRQFYRDSIRPLFPVLLLGPETVSQILPNETDLFDVVIFDEASQLELHKAIPAAFRGEVIFVTGDENQLPPNRVATSSYVEDDDEEAVDIDDENYEEQEEFYSTRKAESFLDQCIHQFERRAVEGSQRSGRMMLDWHYRSEHEDLINFSNHAFYKGHIQIAPHPGQYRSKSAIYYHKVDGLFIKKRNQVEAEKIVQLLREFWMGVDENERPTVGVVTFSAEQQDAIWNEIDRVCSDDRQFFKVYEREYSRKNGEEDVGFFVRNIENVQGDERDIIIFSVGYAPEVRGGDMKMRFGTFSQEKGENRLNVAVTRAKKEVHIVASIEPGELRVEHTTNRGPKALQQYLKYCRLVDSGDSDAVKEFVHNLSSTIRHEFDEEKEFGSDFEIEVYEFLEKNGYKVRNQVGCSSYKIDIAVVDPTYDCRFLCGIECDGATYHSSKDARERDIYRQSFLEDKGWKILRVWSSTWFHQRKIAEEKLLNQIKKLLINSENKKKQVEIEHEDFMKKREERIAKSLTIKDKQTFQTYTEEKQLEISDMKLDSSNKVIDDYVGMQGNSVIGRCPECDGNFRVVDIMAEPNLKCTKCLFVKPIPFELLKKIVREDIFCPRHGKQVLEIGKGKMGVFMRCNYPRCDYLSDVKVKPEYIKK